MFATIALLIFSAAPASQGAARGVAGVGIVQHQTGAVVPDAKVSFPDSLFFTEALKNTSTVPIHHQLDAVVRYDVHSSLRKTGTV